MSEPNYNKLCFFDTETVSISPNYAISLAYIAFENGKLTGKGMIVCNPDYPISPEASKVNGFTNEMVADKPLFKEAWKDIAKYFDNAILIGHNCGFDIRCLNTEFERYNIKPPKFWSCDTLANAKALIPKSKVENFKLGTLCEYFGIELKNAHEADADTRGCLEVYNKLVDLSDGNLIIKSYD